MNNFVISQEQARRFAAECYDSIVRDIRLSENAKKSGKILPKTSEKQKKEEK